MPSNPHIISGVVKIGTFQGKFNLSTNVDVGQVPQVVNVFLGDAVEKSAQTVTLTHSNGVLSTVSNSEGEFAFNLQELSAWNDGDVFTIACSNIVSASDIVNPNVDRDVVTFHDASSSKKD